MLTEQELIDSIPEAKGEEKRELLLRLCDFRGEAADAFWQKRLKRPLTQYLPYLCYSRSDAASDYAAERLEHAVNKMLIVKNQFSAELTEETWYALNLCVFKESERMMQVLDLIGRHYAELQKMSLDMGVLLYSETLPPFLRRMANLAYAHRCEKNVIRLLNDLLICTLVRSDSFETTVLALAERYPEAFGYAGFFASFVNNPFAAYEQYAKPIKLEQVLFSLGGLEFRDGVCEQYSPIWFYGVKNRIWNKKITLDNPDFRWIGFLARAVCYADEAQRKKISAILFRFTGLEDYKAAMQEYFFQAALEDTTETNLVGFMRCGGYDRADELMQGICESICEGKNHYHALFTLFDLLDLKKPEKLRLLSRAREYIEATDDRESWFAQRNHFLHEVKLYRMGKRSEFDG